MITGTMIDNIESKIKNIRLQECSKIGPFGV